jgi:hypothetical protein
LLIVANQIQLFNVTEIAVVEKKSKLEKVLINIRGPSLASDLGGQNPLDRNLIQVKEKATEPNQSRSFTYMPLLEAA